jgi:hypothetical protein
MCHILRTSVSYLYVMILRPWLIWQNNIKMDFKASYEQNNDSSGSMKTQQFLNQRKDCEIHARNVVARHFRCFLSPILFVTAGSDFTATARLLHTGGFGFGPTGQGESELATKY